MSTYIQHDDDGNITAIISSQIPVSGIEAEDAQAAAISPLTHYINGGALTAYSSTEAAAKADRPRHAVSWSNAGMAWVMPSNTLDLMAADAISAAAFKRASLLAETDWMVVRAMESGASVSTSWAIYRQALRDITEQPGYPLNIVWPERPEGA